MDTFWNRNPSKSDVIGRCGGDGKKRMATQNRQKSNAKKNILQNFELRYPLSSHQLYTSWLAIRFGIVSAAMPLSVSTYSLYNYNQSRTNSIKKVNYSEMYDGKRTSRYTGTVLGCHRRFVS